MVEQQIYLIENIDASDFGRNNRIPTLQSKRVVLEQMKTGFLTRTTTKFTIGVGQMKMLSGKEISDIYSIMQNQPEKNLISKHCSTLPNTLKEW